MINKIEVMQMAQAMASHAGLRQAAVSQNIANADTPGYQARDVDAFSATYQSTSTTPLKVTRSSHLDSGATLNAAVKPAATNAVQSPNGNSVSLEDEMVRAVDIKRQHDLALTIYKTSMNVLRTSIGR
jgi:flagellar basal-body rod protein FlgB